VDNDVEKCPLTARKASNGAGFNKMPVWQAVFLTNKIKDLERHLDAASTGFLPVEKIFLDRIVKLERGVLSRPIESFDKNAGEE
jgi:hypothetical protein